MTFIDLCAGIGGFTLGLESVGMRCVGQVEIDPFCRRILTRHWPDVPKWGDLKEVKASDLPDATLICGGYPCQPFSLAGKRGGADDPRHLWPWIRGLITKKRPDWLLFENVVGHISLGLDDVLDDLESLDYTAAPVSVPACAFGAAHRRERLWIVANADGQRLRRRDKKCGSSSTTVLSEIRAPSGGGLPKLRDLPPPRVTRSYDGISHRAHRIRSLGNAVVPHVVAHIGAAILEAERST